MVNYLYNGVELPDINEVWTDKETYPYALIHNTKTSGRYVLEIIDKPITIWLGADGVYKYGCSGLDGTALVYSINIASAVEWSLTQSYGANTSNGYYEKYNLSNGPIFWANFDIMNDDDGSVYLAASEPISAEATQFTIRTSSLLQGIIMGKRLVNMEGTRVKYVASLPIEFTLSASEWNGTTYTLVAEGYTSIYTLQIGLPEVSSNTNTTAVVNAALTIPQVSASTNSETGVTTQTITISAITAPTIDIQVAIFGLLAQETTETTEVTAE